MYIHEFPGLHLDSTENHACPMRVYSRVSTRHQVCRVHVHPLYYSAFAQVIRLAIESHFHISSKTVVYEKGTCMWLPRSLHWVWKPPITSYGLGRDVISLMKLLFWEQTEFRGNALVCVDRIICRSRICFKLHDNLHRSRKKTYTNGQQHLYA